MAKRNWADGVLGNTPLSAARLNHLESDLSASLAALARDPESLFAGAVTYDGNGAPISAVVKWPDGIDGTYSGTASVNFPGAVSAYTITRVLNGSTVTYTQPAITRDATTGNVTNRPPIVITGETVDEYLYPDPVAPSDLDAALVGKINDTSSDTRAALSATYAGIGSDASVPFSGMVPGSFTKWRGALAKVRAGSASAKLLCVGDSTTWGIGSDTANIPDGSYPAQLQKLMNTYLAPAKTGLVVPTSYLESPSVDTRWNLGAGWTEGALGWGNGSDYRAPSGTTAALTYTPGINCDTFDVYYLTAESGRVLLSVDGGATVQTAAPAGQGIDKTTITATAGTGHVLTINNVTGGTAHIIGVDAYLSTDRAVRVGNAGVAGSTSYGWKGDYPAINFSAPSAITKYAPDLTIIMLGINDAGAGYTAAGVKANLQILIDAAKASGDAIIASVVPSGPGIAGITTLEQAYRTEQIALAKSNNIGFVDVYQRYGSWDIANTTGLMAANYPTNDLHPGPNGYADIAAAMFAAIRAIG